MTRPYRQKLIDGGVIVPADQIKRLEPSERLGLQVMRLDDRGRARAEKNILEGERGARMMEMPLGLGLWHEQAMKLREKRERAAIRKSN